MQHRCLLLLLFFISTIYIIHAKVVSGSLKLDSETTEVFLGKFAFSPSSPGTVAGELTSKTQQSYFDNRPHQLVVAFYDDVQWARREHLLKTGSLCRERLSVASHRYPLRSDPNKPGREFSFTHKIEQSSAVLYTFAVVADCMLEEYSSKPPSMWFHVDYRNDGSHLPADEDGMGAFLTVVFVVLVCALCAYMYLLAAQQREFSHRHLVAVLLGGAFVLQLVATALQLAHLYVYSLDGLGLKFRHTWLAADFVSEMAQLLSELTVAFVLICLALGWTLSDSFKISAMVRVKPVSCVLAWVLLSVYLQFKGRQFEDDFNYFHDFSHWPGVMLILLRVLLLVVFWVGMGLSYGVVPPVLLKSEAIRKALLSVGVIKKDFNNVGVHGDAFASTDSSLSSLLHRLLLIGSIWFASFPVSSLLSLSLSPVTRKFFITVVTISAHTAVMLIMLASFLVSSSTFFKTSSLRHMGSMLGGGRVVGKTALD